MNMLKKIVSFLILIVPIFFSYSQNNSIINSGEKIFRDNCAACHKLGRDLIGPDLTGIETKRPLTWLKSFIKNSQSVIKSDDNYAIDLFKEYKQVIMPETQLSEPEIDSVLDYISLKTKTVQEEIILQQQYTTTPVKPPVLTKDYLTKMLKLSIIILVIVILLLPFIYITLKHRITPKELNDYNAVSRFILLLNYFLAKRVSRVFYIINVLIIIILILSWNNPAATAKKYKIQTQVVEFSHSLHCDSFSTDCIFCHSGAENGYFTGLPGIRNCMKCHNYITEGKKYGKKELVKLIIPYKTGKDIHWATGYRYNDYVHFSHSVHYVAGKITCRKCHDDPENVEIKKIQFSMRWCIDCHKSSEINNLNKYYKKISDTDVTVRPLKASEAGGLDCSQCHF